MNTFRIFTHTALIIAAFLFLAGCTATAVPPDEVVEVPPTNTPEPMDTATAVPTSTATPSPTYTPAPTNTPIPTATITPSPTWTPTPDAEALFDVHMQQGMNHAEEGNWEEAADTFSEAIAVDPDNEKVSRAYNNLGLAYQHLGEWEQAIANFDQAIALEPDNADYYANRGDAWRASEEIDAALADYDRAIELDPESPRYFYNRAIAYKQLGELQLALADYDQTILLDPEYAYAYHNRANIHWSLGHYNQAMADFDKALELDPTDQLGFRNRGWLHLDMGDLEAAQADFQQIITLCDPVSYSANEGPTQYISTDDYCFSAYLELAAIACDLDDAEACLEDVKMGISMDPDGAAWYLDDWIEFQPTSGFLYFARGLAEENLNDLDAALADYTQAIQLGDSDPLLQEYYFRRGFVSVMQENGDAAIADWQHAIAIEPTYADAYFYLGLAYFEMGDFEAAIANLEQTIAIEPAYTGAYYYLGMVYSLMEEYETAVNTLQIGLSQDIPQDDRFALANMLVENAGQLLIHSGENSSQAAKATAAIQSAVAEMPGVVSWGAYLNNVCWYGSLQGLAEEVLFACELALEMDPENGSIRDSRGLARALTGDFEGAIEDFQFYVTWAPDHQGTPEAIARREEWIEALQAGNNPFDETLLAELRGG